MLHALIGINMRLKVLIRGMKQGMAMNLLS